MSRPVALLLRPLLAAVAGAVVATAVSLGVVAWIDATPVPESEPWADLGRFLLGLGLAAFVGLLVWAVLLVRAARRLFPVGHRRLPVVASLGLVAGSWVLLGGASTVAAQLGSGPGPGADRAVGPGGGDRAEPGLPVGRPTDRPDRWLSRACQVAHGTVRVTGSVVGNHGSPGRKPVRTRCGPATVTPARG